MITNNFFQSLAVHRFQKQSLLMIIFATRGQWIKLIIKGKYIAKKMKCLKFWVKPMLCTSKKSLEHVEFRSRCKKFDCLWKNQYFQFFDFFSKGGTLWFWNVYFFFFSIFQNFQNNFLKWLQWDLKNIEWNKVMKYKVIWGIHREVTRDHLHMRAQSAPSPHVV